MRSPRLEIEYCTQCRWLARASWMAQELLTTFVDDLREVALVPGVLFMAVPFIEALRVFSAQ